MKSVGQRVPLHNNNACRMLRRINCLQKSLFCAVRSLSPAVPLDSTSILVPCSSKRHPAASTQRSFQTHVMDSPPDAGPCKKARLDPGEFSSHMPRSKSTFAYRYMKRKGRSSCRTRSFLLQVRLFGERVSVLFAGLLTSFPPNTAAASAATQQVDRHQPTSEAAPQSGPASPAPVPATAKPTAAATVAKGSGAANTAQNNAVKPDTGNKKEKKQDPVSNNMHVQVALCSIQQAHVWHGIQFASSSR